MQRTPPTLSPRVSGAEGLILSAATKLQCLHMQSTGAIKLPMSLSSHTISQTDAAKPFDGNSTLPLLPKKHIQDFVELVLFR